MNRENQTSTTDPIRGLQLHASEAATITMSRIHHGVPLFDHVKILEIRDDKVLLQAQNSLVLVDAAGVIHLHSEHLPHPIHAQMLDQDLSKSLFLVGNLAYAPMSWKERKEVRVQPEQPVYFTLERMGSLLRANLLDLEVTGLGASTDHTIIDLLADNVDYSVHMDINLSPELAIKALQGTVCYVLDLNNKAARLGIRTRPTLGQTDQLTRYVEERRGKIIGELMDSYMNCIAPAPVQNQYF
jgi:hypothetical protein